MDKSNLAEIKQVYQPLFDITHSIVLRWNARGIIKYINEYGAHFFGYEPSELKGKNVMTLVPEVDCRGMDISGLANDIVNHPQKYINHVNDNVKKNGEIVHVAWTNKAIKNKKGIVKEVVAIGNDITKQIWTENELLKANQELAWKNQQLEANNDLMQNLLYIAAHDLKGPIGNFRLIFDLIDLSADDQEKLELLPKIRNTYLQLDKVIKGLNDILKIQNVEQHARKIELEELLKDLMENEFKQALQQFNQFVCYDFSAVRKINYVELFLISIFKNMISNAIKYTKDGQTPVVSIKSRRMNDYVLLEVADQGIGIDLKEHGKNLFTPFKRFTKQANGTGIGLYLIKSMICKNGGNIEVESAPGKGTKFICRLKEY